MERVSSVWLSQGWLCYWSRCCCWWMRSRNMTKVALAVSYFLAANGDVVRAADVSTQDRATNLRRGLAGPPIDCALVRCADPLPACEADGCSAQYCDFFTQAFEPRPNNCCPTTSCPKKCQGVPAPAPEVNPCSLILCVEGTECRVSYQNKNDCEGEAECV